jgi:hypothetical protein
MLYYKFFSAALILTRRFAHWLVLCSSSQELHKSQNAPTIFPVSAVFGGLMGQEVIKSLSRKGECANNILYFDGEKAGSVRYPPIPK